jgi:hypothetical protein
MQIGDDQKMLVGPEQRTHRVGDELCRAEAQMG